MKFLKVFFSTAVVFAFLSIGSYTFVSCKKTVTVHDTTIKDIHDTTIKNIHDTTVVKDTIIDTVYNLQVGLIAYYNFNGGNLNDSSGNNNNIVFNNATATTDRFGNPNNAYLFNGSSSYMRVSNSSSLSPTNGITLYAIVKVNGFYLGECHGNEIMMKGFQDQNNGDYGLRIRPLSDDCFSAPDLSTESIAGFYGDNPQAYAFGTSNPVQINQWLKIAYTYDGTTSKLYVNKHLVASMAATVPFNPNNNDLFFGKADNTTYPYWFNGVIDELRIYDRPLCAGAIYELSDLNN